MKHAPRLASFALAALAIAGAATVAATAQAAANAPSKPKHSMNDYAYLIGTWHCTATLPNRKNAVAYTTRMTWKYAPSRAIIDQTVATQRGHADFFLSYTKATDSFHGVFVDSDGNVGFWENPGPAGGRWTEYGYNASTPSTPNTRADFYDVTPTHYAFRFYAISGRTDPGKPIESDTCDKQPA